MAKYVFPFILIALQVCAAFVYLLSGEIKMAVYWAAAAVLNICVTI